MSDERSDIGGAVSASKRPGVYDKTRPNPAGEDCVFKAIRDRRGQYKLHIVASSVELSSSSSSAVRQEPRGLDSTTKAFPFSSIFQALGPLSRYRNSTPASSMTKGFIKDDLQPKHNEREASVVSGITLPLRLTQSSLASVSRAVAETDQAPRLIGGPHHRDRTARSTPASSLIPCRR